jgi:hypothetical protein
MNTNANKFVVTLGSFHPLLIKSYTQHKGTILGKGVDLFTAFFANLRAANL